MQWPLCLLQNGHHVHGNALLIATHRILSLTSCSCPAACWDWFISNHLTIVFEFHGGKQTFNEPINFRSTRRTILNAVAGSAVASVLSSFPIPEIAQGKEITIINWQGNKDASSALAKIAGTFEAKTGVKVTINNMDAEAHKTAIRNYLVVGAPDICFWFSGNRMKAFIKRGLFDNISELIAGE